MPDQPPAPLHLLKAHDYDCLSRVEVGAPCNCTKTGRSNELARGAHPSVDHPVHVGRVDFYVQHGGVSYELIAHGMADPLFKGWASNPDALEEQVCEAIDGLGSFYEEMDS